MDGGMDKWWFDPSYLLALGALGGKELLIASDAIVMIVLGDEALRSQGFLAVVARETVLVPLLPLVFHLLGAWEEGSRMF